MGLLRSRHPDQHSRSIYLGFASTRRTVATRLSNSIGLASKSSGNGLLTLAVRRIRGHADDRNVSGLRIFLQASHRFPTVDNWHFKVHQNYVRMLGYSQLAALLAVLRHENLEIADPLKARLEHVEVVVIVFDIQHFSHDVASVSLMTPALVGERGRRQHTERARRAAARAPQAA